EAGAMDMRVLSHVDLGQVKSERVDASQQPLYTEQARVLAVVRVQTREHHTQITLELDGAGVAIRLVAPRRLETRRDQGEEHAIRQVVIARGDRAKRPGELRAVRGHALAHGVADARP